ncbi:MAG: peptidylprolyl isomerase [Saprospiraceae bacterium]|nr:peptidylprolyl isomerase [Saprospiraceae bacterium]
MKPSSILIEKFSGTFKALAFILLPALLVVSCFPPIEEDLTQIKYSLKDPNVQNIFDARDHRNSDSLFLFLNHPKASYRYLAAISFASYKDSSAIEKLQSALKDPVEEVRQAVVFSLGQIGHSSAEESLIHAFIPVDSSGPFNLTNAMILEALGKCGTDSTLRFICDISSYAPDDTLHVYGQMLAFYRFGLRNKFCDKALEKIIKVATNDGFDSKSRLIASHCLQRFQFSELNNHLETIRRACNEEKDPEIRMCLVSALTKISGNTALNSIEELYSRGLDIRIQANLLKGLSNHSSLQAQFFALKAVQNPSVAVASLAAEYLVAKGSSEIFEELKKIAEQKTLPWQVRAVIFQAALKHIPNFMVITRNELLYTIKTNISQTKNPYEKAAYVKALSQVSKELPNILSYSHAKQHPFVEVTIAQAIENILNKPDFYFIFKGSSNPIYRLLGDYFNKQCDKADPGTLAIVASIFKKQSIFPKKYFNADSMLVLARQKLKLPRDMETYNELSETIAKWSQTNFHPLTPAFNQPIDWNVLTAYKDTIEVKMITNKGDLHLEIYPSLAPGSVLNFIKLVNDGFYKDKSFHRVVPNFVIQSGCPRGDGYGSLDYSIRSEISFMNYQQSGMIGMASAGPDTEGTQFFITHSPAPHLDGRYSIMGKLKSGHDILWSIYQGDVIQNVEIK